MNVFVQYRLSCLLILNRDRKVDSYSLALDYVKPYLTVSHLVNPLLQLTLFTQKKEMKFSCVQARSGFDALESWKAASMTTERQPTQASQRLGYVLGVNAFTKEHPFRSLFKVEPGLPLH